MDLARIYFIVATRFSTFSPYAKDAMNHYKTFLKFHFHFHYQFEILGIPLPWPCLSVKAKHCRTQQLRGIQITLILGQCKILTKEISFIEGA